MKLPGVILKRKRIVSHMIHIRVQDGHGKIGTGLRLSEPVGNFYQCSKQTSKLLDRAELRILWPRGQN